MSALLLNLLVSMVWAVLMGEVNLENLGFGFQLGFAVLVWLRPFPSAAKYTSKSAWVAWE